MQRSGKSLLVKGALTAVGVLILLFAGYWGVFLAQVANIKTVRSGDETLARPGESGVSSILPLADGSPSRLLRSAPPVSPIAGDRRDAIDGLRERPITAGSAHGMAESSAIARGDGTLESGGHADVQVDGALSAPTAATAPVPAPPSREQVTDGQGGASAVIVSGRGRAGEADSSEAASNSSVNVAGYSFIGDTAVAAPGLGASEQQRKIRLTTDVGSIP